MNATRSDVEIRDTDHFESSQGVRSETKDPVESDRFEGREGTEELSTGLSSLNWIRLVVFAECYVTHREYFQGWEARVPFVDCDAREI